MPRRKGQISVQFGVTPELYAQLTERAKNEKSSIANYIRTLVKQDIEANGKKPDSYEYPLGNPNFKKNN